MSKAISIYDAKSNFSKLVAKAKKGEEVVIGTYGKPEVKLVPYTNKKLNIGIWDSQNIQLIDDDLIKPDKSNTQLFEDSTSNQLI